MPTVKIVPDKGLIPERGGVREHLLQLYRHLLEHHAVELADNWASADIIHTESSFHHPFSDVYVCHGGFVPRPIPAVVRSLSEAKIIVSVAAWVAEKYFPQYADKTIVIPNGIRLDEWQDIPPSGIAPGYVFYGKEWAYHMKTLYDLAIAMPDVNFVSLVWDPKVSVTVPDNVLVTGLKSRDDVRPLINDAGALIFTGPEVCPTMMLEAWACKTPVVGFLEAGVREMFSWGTSTDGDGPLYVDGGIPFTDTRIPAMVDVVMDVLANGPIFGHRGYLKAVEHFQWQDIFCRYVDIYEAIVDGRLGILSSTWSETSRKAAGRSLGIWAELEGATRASTRA